MSPNPLAPTLDLWPVSRDALRNFERAFKKAATAVEEFAANLTAEELAMLTQHAEGAIIPPGDVEIAH